VLPRATFFTSGNWTLSSNGDAFVPWRPLRVCKRKCASRVICSEERPFLTVKVGNAVDLVLNQPQDYANLIFCLFGKPYSRRPIWGAHLLVNAGI